MKTKTYYFVEYDAWGQHGTDIDTLHLTKQQAEELRAKRTGFLTDSYVGALYYTQD